MRCMITGALGHIGSKLIREIGNYFKNSEIIMVDSLLTQRYASLFDLPSNTKYQFIDKKVQDVDFNKLLKKVDYCIHLAAVTDASGTANNPEVVFNNNFTATEHIVRACATYKVPLIYPSSTSVYGSQQHTVDETCNELVPQSPYAECKIKEENLIKQFFNEFQLKGVICRLGTIYGVSPGMRFHTAVNKFCWQAVMKQPITVWETAIDQVRPYLSLIDAVEAIVWIMKEMYVNKNLVNIVSSNHTVRDILSHIQNHTGNLDIRYVSHKIMNQLSYQVDAQKIKKEGFIFKSNVDVGIKETIQLLANSNWLTLE